MQGPLNLAEVRHEQRRVAAMLQATPLRYNSIPSTSLYHSNYYNHIKYSYLLNRSWRPLVSNNTDGVINQSETDTQSISLPNINGIKHLYAKYNGVQYVPLSQCDGHVNASVFSTVRTRGSSLVGVEQKSFTGRITHRLSPTDSNGVANFLPNIHNGISDNINETWKVYNSRGLTNVKVRSCNNIGLLSSPLRTSMTGVGSKSMPVISTDELSKTVSSNQRNKSSWQKGGPLKVSAIHDQLSKVDDNKKKFKPNLTESDKNMHKINGRNGAIKLPDISTNTTERKKSANAPAFRYTHRQSDEIADLPTTDELKDILGGDTNKGSKPKVVLVKKTVVKNAGNHNKREDSKLTRNKTGSANNAKPTTEYINTVYRRIYVMFK